MKKILVTGAGGYIGSIACYMLLKKGYEVIGVDNYARGFQKPMQVLQEMFGKKVFKYCECDIRTNIEPVLKAEKNIDAILHYAAYCNVGESEKNPLLYFSDNIGITLALVEAMRKYYVKNIVFSSTCAVYGQPEEECVKENHPLSPTHPYGYSKLMCEQIIQQYSILFGFKYIFLRYFNVCGASDDGLFGDSKKPSFHLMQNAVRSALGISKFELTNTVVDTPDKTPIRDYVNVVDLNNAHIKALEYFPSIQHGEIFNLGTGKGNSVLEIIQTVQNITGKKFKMKQGIKRRTDVKRAVASIDKIAKVLSWKPTHSLKDSVVSLVNWYTNYPHGWTK